MPSRLVEVTPACRARPYRYTNHSLALQQTDCLYYDCGHCHHYRTQVTTALLEPKYRSSQIFSDHKRNWRI